MTAAAHYEVNAVIYGELAEEAMLKGDEQSARIDGRYAAHYALLCIEECEFDYLVDLVHSHGLSVMGQA